jgi:hypothetical protein
MPSATDWVDSANLKGLVELFVYQSDKSVCHTSVALLEAKNRSSRELNLPK